MCFEFSLRTLLLPLSLLITGMTMASETALELPPPLELNLMPDVCEMPVTLSELSLQDAVHVALCKVPHVQQASLSIEEGHANLQAAQAKYFPTLGANADINRIGKHVEYPAHPAANYDLHAYSGNARLGLNWLLFDSGQRSAEYDQARAKLAAALYNKVLVNRDQAITVSDKYYRASSARASATAAYEAAERAEKNYYATQRLREGGVGSIADELLAKVAWQRNLVDSETKAAAAEIAAVALVTAIGLPGKTHIGLPATASISELPARSKSLSPTTASVVAMPMTASKQSPVNERIIAAVRNHPRLAAARANTQAAEAETKSIQAQHRPRLSLQANRDMGITPPANSHAKQNVNSWSIGLTVHIPIFDGLETRYATAASQSRARAARETERTVWLEEELRLLTDFNYMTSANQKMTLLKDAELSAEQAHRSAQVRYREGVGTAIELLKAQDDLATLQQTAIDVHYEWLAAQFRVAVALDTLRPPHVDRY